MARLLLGSGRAYLDKRIQRRIVDVWSQHCFTQIIQHYDPNTAAHPTKSSLVQLSPNTRAGAEDQQSNRFSTVAQGHHEQPSPPVLSTLGIAHHRPLPVVHLRLFAWRSDDHRPSLRLLQRTQLVHVSLDALIARLEAVVGNQILPDGHCVTAKA